MTEHTDMNASSGAGIPPCTHGTRGKGTMSTHAQHEHPQHKSTQHEHGEETEKLQPENTAAEAPQATRHSAVTSPSPAQIKRWRCYLADEESEARIYRYLAQRAEGTDREILLQVAKAEKRHQQHWRDMLGEHVNVHVRPSRQHRPKDGGG